MAVDPRTPVVVGVGQFTENLENDGYRGMSSVELATEAARAALADTGADAAAVARAIDVFVGLRQFEICTPFGPPPLGASDNYLRSVARRVGADPARAVLEPLGGHGPQKLVTEFAGRIATGEAEVSILQVLGFAFTMVTGGNDTTTGLLGTGAELLTLNPGERAQLLAEPRLLGNAVEEMLRLAAPVQGLARTTTRDVVVGDREIPAGRKVMLLYGSANRDPRRFGSTADEFDVDREVGTIMSFGYGAHHCLGAAAARLQSRVVLEELLARCPRFAVDHEAGRFAPGHFVRRYESLPFVADTGA